MVRHFGENQAKTADGQPAGTFSDPLAVTLVLVAQSDLYVAEVTYDPARPVRTHQHKVR